MPEAGSRAPRRGCRGPGGLGASGPARVVSTSFRSVAGDGLPIADCSEGGVLLGKNSLAFGSRVLLHPIYLMTQILPVLRVFWNTTELCSSPAQCRLLRCPRCVTQQGPGSGGVQRGQRCWSTHRRVSEDPGDGGRGRPAAEDCSPLGKQHAVGLKLGPRCPSGCGVGRSVSRQASQAGSKSCTDDCSLEMARGGVWSPVICRLCNTSTSTYHCGLRGLNHN